MRHLIARARETCKERGLSYVIVAGTAIVKNKIKFACFELAREIYYRTTRHGRSFEFNGETYAYLHRRYNQTWVNERSVEIPIVWRIVQQHIGRTLEVGNVLSHYFHCSHDILDKYEKGERVINCDVVDFRPSNRYDLIVSISTLEHVGFDPPEDPNPQKIIQALENLRYKCLAAGGSIVITLPLGYNQTMDRMLLQGKLGFTRLFYLKRVSKDNNWIQTEIKDARNAKFGFPFPWANAIVVGVVSESLVSLLERCQAKDRVS